MMIWKAKMNLIYNVNNKWELIFDFERQNENYEDNGNEWLYSEGWISTRIPKEISIRNSYGNIISEVGFDKKLDETELETLKVMMKNRIIEYINQEKENYLRVFNDKINAIK